jgi:glycogen debranching enzyme
MRIPGNLCQDYGRSSHLEWLETNGTGTFAMGTVSGANTRRYHGYLVAGPASSEGRQVWLAKVDEAVNGQPLGVNQFPGSLHPQGYRQLVEFTMEPYPRWTYQAGRVRLRKSLFLVPGRNIAVVEYSASEACHLTVRPFVAARGYHALRREGAPPTGCHLHAINGEFLPEPDWWHDFEYLIELDRGFPFREDLFTPGLYRFDLHPGQSAALVAAVEPGIVPQIDQWRADRIHRGWDPANDFAAVRGNGQPTLMAGYPWFTDWGRDTMIALPGLLIGRGRLAEARAIIDAFLAHADQGLIPNRFPDIGETPEYHSVDGTLLLIAAVQELQAAGGKVDDLRPALQEMVSWLRRGTYFQIQVDPEDGLLAAGDRSTNLTWMDARLDGEPVTSRHGKAVEINALWLNGLAFLGDPELPAATAKFQEKFWNGRYLSDCIGDDRLRPNQLLAISLPYLSVTPLQGQSILDVIETELFTPVGLRTLSPRDPQYQGRYEGSPATRDAAYHQGTVWPWLMGPYLLACLRLRPERRSEIEAQVIRWREETTVGCLGHIAEIYDGDAPHRPVGAPAQAWSLAELLRVEQRLAR